MFHFFVLYVLSIFSVYGSHVCVTSFPEQFIVVLPGEIFGFMYSGIKLWKFVSFLRPATP